MYCHGDKIFITRYFGVLGSKFVRLARGAIGVKKESYFLTQAAILSLLGTVDEQGDFLISDSAYYLNVTKPIPDYPQWGLDELRATVPTDEERGRRFLQLAHQQGNYQASELLATMYLRGGQGFKKILKRQLRLCRRR